MRVLFLVYGDEHRRSGGYLYDRRMIAHLKRSGDTVMVQGLPEPSGFPLALERFRTTLRGGTRPPAETAASWRRYDAVVVDALVHPTAGPYLEVLERIRARTGGRPKIIVLVQMLSSVTAAHERRSHLRLEAGLLEHADLIIANSGTTADTITKLFAPAAPIGICPPGRDGLARYGSGPREMQPDRERSETHADSGSESPLPSGVRLFASGNVIPGKGYHLLVQALEPLEPLPWSLSIAGSLAVAPAYVRRLYRAVHRAGLSGRIRFAGDLSEAELALLHDESDLFVLPSRYESYGIALAEALDAGLPVVAFETGAVPETASSAMRVSRSSVRSISAGNADGSCGFLVPRFDTAAFGEAVSALVMDSELRRVMAAAAKRTGETLPRWSESERRFRELVEATVHIAPEDADTREP